MTPQEKTNRLLSLLLDKWNGESLASLALKHGISRQRVHAILSLVDCTPTVSQPVTTKVTKRGSSARAAKARAILEHPQSGSLTVRQRTAIAWQALGLALSEVGIRMGISAQGAQALIVAGKKRMQRVAFNKQKRGLKSTVRKATSKDITDQEFLDINLDDI